MAAIMARVTSVRPYAYLYNPLTRRISFRAIAMNFLLLRPLYNRGTRGTPREHSKSAPHAHLSTLSPKIGGARYTREPVEVRFESRQWRPCLQELRACEVAPSTQLAWAGTGAAAADLALIGWMNS